MRNKETMRKLLEMRLSGMVEIYEEQTRNLDYEKMTFNQRFNLIVDYEYSRRQSNKLNRLIKQARFSDSTAAIEDIEYHPDRHLDKDLILELASCNYIKEKHNIILMGPQVMVRLGFQMHLEYKPVVNISKSDTYVYQS